MECLQLQAWRRPVRHAAGRSDLARQTSTPSPGPPWQPVSTLLEAESSRIGLLPCRTDIFAVDQKLSMRQLTLVEQRSAAFTGMGQLGGVFSEPPRGP